MKRTFLDKFIGFFSPIAENSRVKARVELDATLRAYDIAKTAPTSDWTSANSNSANEETKSAIGPGRNKARALVQNNPYGLSAVEEIVSETVGSGIMLNLKAKDEKQTEVLNKLWKKWAESNECDFDGDNNFYGLQQLVMRSMVESGEGFGLYKMKTNGPSIRLLESDYIATTKDEGNIIQGIELDADGIRSKYHIYKKHPGGRESTTETVTVPASEVIHVYKKTRAGQLRGVTWAHAVLEKAKDFEDYQHATLIRQKVAACFGGFIETTGNDSLLDPTDVKAKREAEMSMTPATWWYLDPGEKVSMANPPSVDGYEGFNRETLRAQAKGWGISYESLSGDYSQSNYSSSRLGAKRMQKNVETWRWNILIPKFCDPTLKRFLVWAKLQAGISDKDLQLVTWKWVPPAPMLIDPEKEIQASQKEVRSGFKSWGDAVLEQGQDPEETLKEIEKWNKRFDELGIKLDTDPRHMSQQGMMQMVPTEPDPNDSEKSESSDTSEGDKTSESTDEKNVAGKSDPSTGKRKLRKRRK